MSEPYIGEIMLFAGNYPPKDWALCFGQILPISQYTALFSILGTTYGGNGTTNFALPNLVDRFALGPGQGPGLTQRPLGETGGSTQAGVGLKEMGRHTHVPAATSAGGNAAGPAGAVWATSSTRDKQFATGPTNTDMAANLVDIAPAGGGNAHDNQSPGLSLTYIMCLNGLYPQRP